MGPYARERVAELSEGGNDLVTFWRECTELLKAAVPIMTSRAGTRSIRCRF
ncbi:MAG: hypothetical protein ICV69_12770 [Thermoleophilaceae bacterium]|nr:hypothetical protein [Thermoleophilaceae bacterium]